MLYLTFVPSLVQKLLFEQFLLPSVDNSQTGLSRDDQRNGRANRVLERHSFLKVANNLRPFPITQDNPRYPFPP